jgi:hypothetical protein
VSAQPKRRVFIPNRSRHDFSKAERFGTPVFLTSGLINRLETSQMCRVLEGALESSSPDDLLLPSSLTVLSMLAGVILAMKHGRLNMLIYCDGDYVERNVNFTDLKETLLCSVPLETSKKG